MKVGIVQACLKSNIVKQPVKKKAAKKTVKMKPSIKPHRKNVMHRTRDLDILFFRANPDIAAKVAATKVMLQNPNLPAPQINYNSNEYNYNQIKDISFEEALSIVKNPRTAYNMLGAYGLMAYTHSMLDEEEESKLLPKINNHKVREAFYDSNTLPISQIFNKYMNFNKNGYTDEIYQRFGQVGRDLTDYYLEVGAITKNVDADQHETYKATDMFDDIVDVECLDTETYLKLFNKF